MEIKIKSESGIVPAYETAGSAGMDIRAYLKEPVELLPGQRALIPTGIYLEIPEGYEVQIRARSGLAIKRGIGLVNGLSLIHIYYAAETGGSHWYGCDDSRDRSLCFHCKLRLY